LEGREETIWFFIRGAPRTIREIRNQWLLVGLWAKPTLD